MSLKHQSERAYLWCSWLHGGGFDCTSMSLSLKSLKNQSEGKEDRVVFYQFGMCEFVLETASL